MQSLQLWSNENARIKIAKKSNIPKAYTEVSTVQEEVTFEVQLRVLWVETVSFKVSLYPLPLAC